MKTQDDRIVRLDVALSRNTGDRLTGSGEADAVLDLLGVEHRGCIAVGDADDVAFEKGGGGGPECQDQE